MRTNIDIDDDLMAKALSAGPYKTKKDAVEAGLKLLARQAAYREILKWRGKLKWEGDESIDWTQPGADDPAAAASTAQEPAPKAYPGSAVLVVDSSVWIDYFNDADHPAVELLDQMLDHGEIRIVVPDLVMFEVLRGFRDEHHHRQAKRLLQGLHVEDTGSAEMALVAAQHYRSLRTQGITVRSGIDVLVAAFCIERDYALLHRDRDFAAFETHRGLRGWRH